MRVGDHGVLERAKCLLFFFLSAFCFFVGASRSQKKLIMSASLWRVRVCALFVGFTSLEVLVLS